MGIDIGSADTIGQIGPPSSVSALRQRLGRSGRRGGPCHPPHVRDRARSQRLASPSSINFASKPFQTIAVVELLLGRWYEPPNTVQPPPLDPDPTDPLGDRPTRRRHDAASTLQRPLRRWPLVHVTRSTSSYACSATSAHTICSVQASDGTTVTRRTRRKTRQPLQLLHRLPNPAQEYRLVAHGRDDRFHPDRLPHSQLAAFSSSPVAAGKCLTSTAMPASSS